MSSPNPPDPSRADRAGRPPADPAAARPGPAGEGWDDGRGNRPQGGRPPRRRGAGSGRAAPAARPGDRKHLPRWLIPAMAVALVLIILLVVVFGGGSDARKDAGSCLTDLMAHIPEESQLVSGTDLVQARDAGYQDGGTLEELGDSQAATGALPDALTAEFRFSQLLSDAAFAARTGVRADQIDCSLSDDRRSVLSGSFDVAEVDGSTVGDAGRLAATEDLVALTVGKSDPKKLLEPRDGGGLAGNEEAKTVLESLRDQGAYTVVVQAGNPNAEKRARAAGLGIAEGTDDDRALVVAWSFADEDAAKAGRGDVVERVNDVLAGTTSIRTDDLTVEASLVIAKLDVRRAPQLRAVMERSELLIPRG